MANLDVVIYYMGSGKEYGRDKKTLMTYIQKNYEQNVRDLIKEYYQNTLKEIPPSLTIKNVYYPDMHEGFFPTNSFQMDLVLENKDANSDIFKGLNLHEVDSKNLSPQELVNFIKGSARLESTEINVEDIEDNGHLILRTYPVPESA